MKLNSLRYRIAATIFILEAIMMAAVLWLSLSSSFDATKTQIDTSDLVTLKNISELGRIALLTDEYNDLQPFLETAVIDPHVLRVLLTNDENIIYASSDSRDLGRKSPVLTDTKNEYWRSLEISNASGVLGNLRIRFSNLRLDAAFNDAMTLGIGIAIFGMIIIAFAGLFFGIMLTRRLEILNKTANEFAHGNFTAQVNVQGDDEIEALGNTLNQMAVDINHNLITLSESEERFRSIFNSSNDAIFLIDFNNDCIVDANKSACKMLEYECNELLKTPVSKIHSYDMQLMQNFVNEVLEKGSAYSDEFICMTKNSEKISASISASQIIIDGKKLLLAQTRNITDRKLIEQKLANSERLFRTLVESSPIAVCQTDMQGNCIYVNENWLEQTGLTIEQCLGQAWHLPLYQSDRDIILRRFNNNALNIKPWDLEYRFSKPDGSIRWLISRVVALRDVDNRVSGYLFANIDVSDHKQTEKALRRSQKMQAIGQLTGGIAHDFNNILGAIMGNIELLEIQTKVDDKTQKRFDTIKHSSQRAADLTRQLLGFSRTEATTTKVTNINQMIESMQTLIIHSLTPQVEVKHVLAEDLWPTKIDPGDFEDALLNLILNARDAMGGRGKLTIETRNSVLDESYCALNPDVTPGEYVELAISDSGEGIPLALQDRIFEPFFTSKAQGKGTGLGLAMVFGFVNRSSGNIKLYSEPGIGTTFRIYLPHSEEEEKTLSESDKQTESVPRGHETILVVDDEKSLLELVNETLQRQGYKVLTASNGAQALSKLTDDKANDIALLFSDVVMPGGMNGYELAEQATAKRPELKVLLTSGFTEKAIARNGQSRFNANLLSKPYMQRDLVMRMRELLG